MTKLQSLKFPPLLLACFTIDFALADEPTGWMGQRQPVSKKSLELLAAAQNQETMMGQAISAIENRHKPSGNAPQQKQPAFRPSSRICSTSWIS